jgi:hypothetical protein
MALIGGLDVLVLDALSADAHPPISPRRSGRDGRSDRARATYFTSLTSATDRRSRSFERMRLPDGLTLDLG